MTEFPRFFSQKEMACRCCGTYNREVIGTAHELQIVRIKLGQKMPINSAYRCPAHNKKVGGKPNSFHLRGLAVDIDTRHLSGYAVYKMQKELEKVGFRGFILYDGFLHADRRTKGLLKRG